MLCLLASANADPVQLGFLPPPLEKATFSLGIFDLKTGKLVRHLQTGASERDFTVGLNGLLTTWDGKDNHGRAVAPGRYAARGYAVGSLKVEGENVQGNDWAGDDEALRIAKVKMIRLNPEDEGLVVMALDPRHHELTARYGGPKTEFLHAGVGVPATTASEANPAISEGKDGTTWKIEDGVLSQYSREGERLRSLANREGEPVPVAVAASKTSDRIYLLEESQGWQRVRGLSWLETKEEAGHPVSTWQTFFEHSIRVQETADAAGAAVEVTLVENPLVPGKPQKVRLTAASDEAGSYLATENGLRLRRISERANLENVRLAKGKTPGGLSFFQYDGAATDEFLITGIRNIMEFDAGEFEMTATGEKPADPKPTEPPDL